MKTAISSTACGTSTLKSPLLLGSDAPHVHPRLRKYRSRCTLDCGFKTSESPALRGFVGGPWALATAALYLVIFSNGLRHPKNLPVKFGFSPKTVSTNIARKLPSQRCPQPLLIPIFNFSHKRPTFAFTVESGCTPGFRRKIAHKGTHGETRAVPSAGTAWLCAASKIALNTAFVTLDSVTLLYTYISQFTVNPQHQQKGKIWQSCCHKFYPPTAFHRVFQLLAQTAHVRFHRRKRVHTRLSEKDRTQRHTRRNRGRFGWGCYYYPRTVSHVSETLRGQGVERQTLPILSLGRVCARRTQRAFGTAMRLCASLFRRRRGPAGLRDPVAIVSMIKNMINPWAGSFLIFCWANANSIKKVVLQPF